MAIAACVYFINNKIFVSVLRLPFPHTLAATPHHSKRMRRQQTLCFCSSAPLLPVAYCYAYFVGNRSTDQSALLSHFEHIHPSTRSLFESFRSIAGTVAYHSTHMDNMWPAGCASCVCRWNFHTQKTDVPKNPCSNALSSCTLHSLHGPPAVIKL